MSPLTLSPSSRRAFDRMAADCQRVFADRFDAVVAYDPHRSVVFAKSVSAADLDALAPLVEIWHRDGVRTPLVMTRAEFHRSLDAFPLEYQAIVNRHLLIAGADPFGQIAIAPEDLRRACEVQAKAHLIHLRQGWLEAAGHEHDLAELIEESAAPWRVLLENVARLRGLELSDPPRLAAWAATVTGMPEDLARALLETSDDHNSRAAKLIPRLPEYVAAAEHLWAAIDSWRA